MKVKEQINLPFEVDMTYKTKFATGEMFKVTQLVKNKEDKIIRVLGIYENSKHLGECPIGLDRLIPISEYTGKELEMTECPHCNKLF